MDITSFKNIIFDLGGVIINLDEKNTMDAFARLNAQDQSDIKKSILEFDAFKRFEKGQISADEFREEVRVTFRLNATDQQMDDALNAMLLDIPGERLSLLDKLRPSYRLFLLSNTNSIHMKRFNEILQGVSGKQSIDEYFERAYYSHLVHMRKPDHEIFQLILDQNELIAGDTLFLDDNRSNLNGAKSLGIGTFHVESPAQLFDLFK